MGNKVAQAPIYVHTIGDSPFVLFYIFDTDK